MLSFDTALSNALKPGNTTAFWVLKLYYNDDTSASNFIGVSDSHRIDGTDIYNGLVSSWGNYHQSLNFFDFSTSTGNMTIKLINTKGSISKTQPVYEDDFSTGVGLTEDVGTTESATIGVSDATNLSVGDYIEINSEVMLITAISSNDITVTRHIFNPDPAATTHSNRDLLYYHTDNRFSDLLRSFNFANRKWELFMNTSQAGTYDAAARMIGTGVISGNIDYDTRFITFILLDMSSKYYSTIPRTTVNTTDHPNAPDTNFSKPVPISYGDFWEKEDIGTILTTNFDRFHQFYKGTFPAIVTNEWDATNARIEASCDILSMTTLDADNIYGRFKNRYGQCETTTKDQPSAKITATGDDWRLYVPLQSHATYASGGATEWSNYANTINGEFDGSYVNFTGTGDSVKHIGWRIPKVEKLGTLTSVHLIMSLSNGTGTIEVDFSATSAATAGAAPLGSALVGAGDSMSDANGEQSVNISGLYGGTDAAEWDLEDEIFLVLDDTGGTGGHSIRIYEIGLMIEFKQEDGFEMSFAQIQEYNTTRAVDVNYGKSDSAGTIINQKRTLVSSRNATVPAISSYLFYNGKGRKSGAWIDTNTAGDARVNGLNKGNVIESPIYIIEDILRTECGTIKKGAATSTAGDDLVDSGGGFTTDMVGQTAYYLTDGTSAFITARESATVLSVGADIFEDEENYYICGLTDDEIDTTTFDAAGNTASSAGDVYNALGGAASTSEWAFAQAKFTGAQDLIYRISRQCGAYVFISGNGKVKIKVLKRSGHSEDREVDFNDIDLKEIKLTSLNNVRNNFIVNYNKDYGADQYRDTVTASDSTSQGSGSTGYNQELTLELDADVVSSATATQIADMYKAFFKDRHIKMSFNCLRPSYNDLEITDIIKFTNWDTNIKIYGKAMGTDYYIVQDISKSVNGCSVTAIKVS